VEQILIDQEGAALNGGSLSIPDGTQLVDKSVFNSIINRLEAAETKGKTITTYEETIQRLEKELKDLREAHLKHEAAVKKSFEDVDAAFVDLESQVQVEEPETTVDVVVTTEEEVVVDLKSLVQQDLLLLA
jgi:predicted  nucleic acid-binding Zn-ribbon protein